MSRTPKHVVKQFEALNRTYIPVTQHHFREDFEGRPSHVEVTTEDCLLVFTPEMFGWTQEELDDPEVTE